MNDQDRPAPAATELEAVLTELARTVPLLAPALAPAAQALAPPAARRRSVYLLGTIKSGKSTLVNALLGRDVMPRGAGVKTFNQTRARPGAALAARIRFRSAQALTAELDFDFRMLGMPTEVPADPYSRAGSEALEAALADFETLCREDERLSDVDADASLLGLLPRSLARLRRSIRGLARLHAQRSPEEVAAIARDAELVFGEADFERYRDWTESPDEAALIRDIELTFPPAVGTAPTSGAAPSAEGTPSASERDATIPDDAAPAGVDLVDCQGSDSLNALDFADVEAAISRADVILYVVQSRLGLRQGDRDLLRLLARAGAASRLHAVLNVDAFDPMDTPAFEALVERTQAELQTLIGAPVELLALAAVAELDRRLGDQQSAELMRGLWARREATAVLDTVLDGFEQLRAVLANPAPDAGSGPDSGADDASALRRGVAERARTVVDAALGRDARLLGKDSSGASRAQALAAVQRILDGERLRLREEAAAQVDEAFADDAAVVREIDDFLARAGTRYERQRPLPEALLAERKSTRTLDAALAAFNEDWLGEAGSERHAQLATLRGWLAERVFRAHERIERMLPPSAAAGASIAERPERADLLRAEPEAALARIVSAVAVPRLLVPVVLPMTVRQALAAEFVSRGWLARLKRADDAAADELLARRAETLWKRALGAAFRQAEDDRRHQLPSARENFKFQYCYRIIDTFIGMLAAEILADVERHHADLERLARSERLLLDGAQREQLEAGRDALLRLAGAPR